VRGAEPSNEPAEVRGAFALARRVVPMSSRFGAKTNAKALRAVPLEAALGRQVVLARRRQRSLSPAAQRLWELIAALAPQPALR